MMHKSIPAKIMMSVEDNDCVANENNAGRKKTAEKIDNSNRNNDTLLSRCSQPIISVPYWLLLAPPKSWKNTIGF